MVQARDEAKLSERMGNLLYRLREQQKLTQRAAAKLIGISQARLVSLEQGRDLHTGRPTLPSPEITVEIARVYQVPKLQLMLLAGHNPWFLEEDEAEQLVNYVTGMLAGGES